MKPAHASRDIIYPATESLPIDEKVATKVIMFTAKNKSIVFIGYDLSINIQKLFHLAVLVLNISFFFLI